MSCSEQIALRKIQGVVLDDNADEPMLHEDAVQNFRDRYASWRRLILGQNGSITSFDFDNARHRQEKSVLHQARNSFGLLFLSGRNYCLKSSSMQRPRKDGMYHENCCWDSREKSNMIQTLRKLKLEMMPRS